jgi:hypothetical protein
MSVVVVLYFFCEINIYKPQLILNCATLNANFNRPWIAFMNPPAQGAYSGGGMHYLENIKLSQIIIFFSLKSN